MVEKVAIDCKFHELIADVLTWYSIYDDEKDATDSSRMEWAVLNAIKHRLLYSVEGTGDNGSSLQLSYDEIYYLSMVVHYARNAGNECTIDAEALTSLYKYLYDIRGERG